MRRLLPILLVSLLALPALAAAKTSLSPSLLQRAADDACLGFAHTLSSRAATPCAVSGLTRRVLAGDVAEYSFALRVGAGPFDVIGLHRVVREAAPFEPRRTHQALLMIHGDIWGWDTAFLSDPGRNLPVFLAHNDVDVWGIDLRWVRVPASTTDFTFMRDWGIAHDARDVETVLTVARAVRLLGGDGGDRLALLGWSRGGIIGYAVLDAETQRPRSLRNVDAYIPVDIYLKTNDETFRQNACRRLAAEQAQLAAGGYQNTNGSIVGTIAALATANPTGSSPVFPGLTNYQAALLTGEATFVFFPPDQQPVPFYHFTAGTFAAAPAPSGLPVPTGLTYSPEPTFLRFLGGAAPFQAERELADSDLAICNEHDAPFADHLSAITVPILYVGAGGGFGDYGIYTTTLLGSTDVTTHVVHVAPATQRLSDYGHADLFLGRHSDTLVWQPILDWLRVH